MFLGGDMCWLGNGAPFNGEPCPKNFVADPIRMFFAYLWVRLTDFVTYSPWGFPLYVGVMLATFGLSIACFAMIADEIDHRRHSVLQAN